MPLLLAKNRQVEPIFLPKSAKSAFLLKKVAKIFAQFKKM